MPDKQYGYTLGSCFRRNDEGEAGMTRGDAGMTRDDCGVTRDDGGVRRDDGKKQVIPAKAGIHARCQSECEDSFSMNNDKDKRF